jgi:hypothetical protein
MQAARQPRPWGTNGAPPGFEGRSFTVGEELFAQFTASAGNGGVATSSANGGAASTGDINSGGNAGNAIGVGDTSGGNVGVDGGSFSANTGLGISTNGGTAISDASGGSYNLAFVS